MSDGGGSAFGGTNGLDISSEGVAIAANPAAMTDIGFAMQDITVDPPDTPGSLFDAVLGVFGALFGITPAHAGTITMTSLTGLPVVIGYMQMPLGYRGGLNLAQALLGLGATMSRTGTISMMHDGSIIGQAINGMSFGRSGAMVNIDSSDAPQLGPEDLDGITIGATMIDSAGSAEVGLITPSVWAQITNLGGVPIPVTLPTPLIPTGINSSVGIPVTDALNVTAMFSKKKAYLLPGMIGGLDGIYSLSTGQRIVPPANVGAAPKGFSLGQYATFAQTNLLLAGSSAGYQVALGAYGEVLHVTDPATHALFSPISYTYVKVFNGSQMIGLLPAVSPGNAYTGPNPTMASPGYNTADMVSPVVMLTNLIFNNNASMSPAGFFAQNPNYNGGGEGPGG